MRTDDARPAQLPLADPPPARWSLVDLTVKVPPNPRPPRALQQGAAKPRWRTVEFYCYYLVFLLVVPQMWYIAHTATSSACSLSAPLPPPPLLRR